MPVTFKKAGRDERLAIRLSPQDKFAAELYARKHDETVSSAIKSLMTAVFKSSDSGLYKHIGEDEVFLPSVCWDELYPDRVVKLALNAPELLDRNESIYWKVIEENAQYWTGKKEPDFKRIRAEWDQITATAMKMLDEYG